MNQPARDTINLNKYISETGICSRRGAEEFIASGRVTINGVVAKLGNRVGEGDVVLIDGKPLKVKPKLIYLALNKPAGIVCTTETHVRNNIVDFVNYHQRLFPIGRLDKDSEGLIFLTNDGDIVNKILRAGNNHEKEYIVRLDKAYNGEFIRKMANGVPILDTVTQKCRVWGIDRNTFGIILTQGLNRQIRRMCEYFGYEVTALKRIRIMNISLGNLKKGTWRMLSEAEMSQINNLVKTSLKTEEASRKSHKG
ncbi:MAG: 23S rRNA pseudouridine(2604) synthase RluF [Flavobacteriales bacterium]|nr:23S rRNA pseudouridine(2604) synthase RluF [Flavobacteriales bacterium]